MDKPFVPAEDDAADYQDQGMLEAPVTPVKKTAKQGAPVVRKDS